MNDCQSHFVCARTPLQFPLSPPPHLPTNTPASAPSSTNDILCVAVQDPFEPVIYIGGHIKLTQGGPWVRRGPPVVTRQLQILGSCGFINNRGGELAFWELGFTGLGGVGRLCCFWGGCGRSFPGSWKSWGRADSSRIGEASYLCGGDQTPTTTTATTHDRHKNNRPSQKLLTRRHLLPGWQPAGD